MAPIPPYIMLSNINNTRLGYSTIGYFGHSRRRVGVGIKTSFVNAPSHWVNRVVKSYALWERRDFLKKLKPLRAIRLRTQAKKITQSFFVVGTQY